MGPDLDTIQKVVDLTADFAACTKHELSIKKSFAFCSDPAEDCTVLLDGAEMKVVADADVLGARISFHGSRVEEPLRSKATSAKLIAERILLAPLAFEQRALLVRALVTSKVTYGSAIAAIPWSDFRKLRTVVSSAVWGRRSKFRCGEVLFSLLCHGHATDPVWATSYCSLTVCQRILARRPALRSLFCTVWELRKGRRSLVVGPVGNLFHAVKQLGLSWPSPLVLQNDVWDRQPIDLLAHSSKEFAHMLRDCTRHLLWSRAGCRRQDLAGLQTGVDIEATCQLLRASRQTQVHKGLLRSILSGGVVSGQRAHKARFCSSAICEFCNCLTVESVHHLFWECPAWANIRNEHPLAVASWRPDWPACFACCGILCDGVVIPVPADDAVYPVPEPAPEPGLLELDEHNISGRVEVYTDGACTFNQIASLRRAGFGAWWADDHPKNFSCALEGQYQTNNRAELAAVLQVLRTELRKVHIKTDSAYVLRGCQRLRFVWAALGWLGILNTDLWQQVHALMLARGDDVAISKVKGHATAQDVAAGRVTQRDKQGNDSADKLATNGAKSNSMPPEHVRDVLHRRSVTKAVQSMMIAILSARMHASNRHSDGSSAHSIDSDSDSLLLSSSSCTESSCSESSSELFEIHLTDLAIHSGFDHPT